MGKQKPVYLYDINMNLIKKFETTKECAEFFEKNAEYINHSLIYNSKIRKGDEWYIISREKQ